MSVNPSLSAFRRCVCVGVLGVPNRGKSIFLLQLFLASFMTMIANVNTGMKILNGVMVMVISIAIRNNFLLKYICLTRNL